MGVKTFLSSWPVYRQLTGTDPLGRGAATKAPATGRVTARITTADSVTQSVCPYCAVGCGQKVYAKDGRVVQIEGDPESPVSRGRLCPKGSASEQLVNAPGRITQVMHRRPGSGTWEHMALDDAMERVAELTLKARAKHWTDADENGVPLRRTTGIAVLGGATLDNEENYLIKKLLAASGAVQVENQARI